VSGEVRSGPRPPTDQQRLAADPDRSVWVTANAGTGKTRVLTDRILRLLLAGADPEGILAITFTKAAAAEMTQRIERRLTDWATFEEEALAADLEALLGRPAREEERSLARALLARLLDLPRGLSIATIHAFCQTLLRRFPLEAGVAPHFEAIDEHDAAELQREAYAQILSAAHADTGPLGRAVANLAVWLADSSLEELLGDLLGQRTRLQRAREAHGGLDGLLEAVARALRAEPGLAPRQVVERACADGVFDADRLARAAEVLRDGAKRDGERASRIAAWIQAVPTDRFQLFDDYARAFVGSNGEPLQERSLMSKALADRHPDLLRALVREQARLLEVDDTVRRQMVYAKTEAMLVFGFAVLDRYEELKKHRAALDFDDLIEHTRRLLAISDQRDWVLFRLDARIDHVLVDEAQDTSPAQWEIVERLTEEFFAGEGARGLRRTLFVVGDEKQSIYRFQGADLDNFRAVRDRIVARSVAARRPIETTLLDRSFRSVPAILELVDAVFEHPQARIGVSDGPLHHASERASGAGIVELWPLARAPAAEEAEEPWALPDAPTRRVEGEQLVAEAVAREIAGWLERRECLPASGRPIRGGDVLILVSRRGTIQERIVRALRRSGVPVAGADRLALQSHLAVQDLLALGEVLLLPENDLALACLLKSPLLGLDENRLFELAHGRGPVSLMERLRARAGSDAEDGPFRRAYARLEEWLRRADFMPPFELFTWILGADGGRRRILERLGPEALDPLEAFLGQALAYEQGHPASLRGFLAWFRLGAGELKRDPEAPGDRVRVSTVHGAKGLEAPIVILADAGPHGDPRPGKLLWGEVEPALGSSELPFWREEKKAREPLTDSFVEAEKQFEEEENHRLLYVALTRAAERLIVTGWHNKRTARNPDQGGESAALANSWHGIVRRALEHLDGVETVEGHGLGEAFPGPILRYRRGVPVAVTERLSVATPSEPLPDWLARAAPEEPRPPRPLAPSRVLPEPLSPGRLADAEAARRRRYGTLVHRLLELLPALRPADRPAAVDRFLARFASDLEPSERDRLRADVTGLLERPDLAPLFAPGALVEQAIVGLVGDVPVSGQIDRLLVSPDEVVAIDFKTGRRPATPPEGYLRQMALYRALLVQRFPDRKIRCGLLWTEAATVDWLDEARLAALAPGPPP
jgi:ATP-dependent helicase/nuclease subunit A